MRLDCLRGSGDESDAIYIGSCLGYGLQQVQRWRTDRREGVPQALIGIDRPANIEVPEMHDVTRGRGRADEILQDPIDLPSIGWITHHRVGSAFGTTKNEMALVAGFFQEGRKIPTRSAPIGEDQPRTDRQR
jgi:hypothetical protein